MRYQTHQLLRDHKTFPNCIHQDLISENPVVPACGKAVLKTGSHGFLCEEHYGKQARHRFVPTVDADTALINWIIASEQRAIGSSYLEIIDCGRAGSLRVVARI